MGAPARVGAMGTFVIFIPTPTKHMATKRGIRNLLFYRGMKSPADGEIEKKRSNGPWTKTLNIMQNKALTMKTHLSDLTSELMNLIFCIHCEQGKDPTASPDGQHIVMLVHAMTDQAMAPWLCEHHGEQAGDQTQRRWVNE